MTKAVFTGGEARLFILLPVHNRRETTVRFVESLGRQTWQDFKLILIDDGSTDGTALAVRKLRQDVVVISGTGSWWWAGSLDQGCRHLARTGVVDGDVLLLINDDVEIGPDFLAHALAELADQPDTLLLARQTDAATGEEIDHGGGVKADLAQMRFAAAERPDEINCLPTRGLFLRWRDFQRTGGFCPQSLPHYLSDYEFTIRAGRHGLRLAVARTAALGVRPEQSGRSLKNLFSAPRARRFRLIFSRRYKDNPVTWSAFVWRVAAPARKPYLWLKIWTHFLVTATRALFRPVEEIEVH
jgi:GT2 family glycosyltransferase